MMADIDEKIEGMCDECKAEIKKKTCTRCGKVISETSEAVTNKSFDESKFKAMAGGIDG